MQRIIHKHAGRIWVDSEPGLGATFYFTIGSEESKQAAKNAVDAVVA